jgi:hypothetical protein
MQAAMDWHGRGGAAPAVGRAKSTYGTKRHGFGRTIQHRLEKTTLKGKSAIVTGSMSGIDIGIAGPLANGRCNSMLNGFGETSAIEENVDRWPTTSACELASEAI